MSTFFKRIIAAMLALILTAGMVPENSLFGFVSAPPVFAEEGTGSEGSSNEDEGRVATLEDNEHVKYYRDENDYATGYEQIMVDGTTYYDVMNNKYKAIDSRTLQDILDQSGKDENVKQTIMRKWAKISVGMIGSLNDWYSTNNENFWKNYTRGYRDDEQQINLEEVFSSIQENGGLKNNKVQGSRGDDYAHSTGLYSFDRLSDLRKKMVDDLNYADKGDIGTKKLYSAGASKKNDSVLPHLRDAKDKLAHPGFAKIVTTVNQEGYTYGYDYVCFGIGYYDFNLVPITSNDITTITDFDLYRASNNPIKDAAADGNTNVTYVTNSIRNMGNDESGSLTGQYVENNSSQETTEQQSVQKTITETASNSVTDGSTYSLGVDVTATHKWGVNLPGLLEGKFSFTIAFGITKNWSSSKTYAKDFSETTILGGSVSSVLPPHTANMITTKEKTDSWSFAYKYPVALTYKVVIFGMSGHYYSDGVVTQYIHTAGYHHGNFEFFLGEGKQSYGATANENLAYRLNRYKSSANKDEEDRDSATTYAASDNKTYDVTHINWNEVKEYVPDIETYPKYVPMLGAGAQMSYDAKTRYNTLGALQPLYPLKKVALVDSDNENIELDNGSSLLLDSIYVRGFNESNIPYYGFDRVKGHWEIIPENASEDAGQGASVEQEPAGKITKTKNGNQIFNAENPGEIHLKWTLDPGVKLSSVYGQAHGSKPYDIDSSNFDSRVNAPIITIKVNDVRNYTITSVSIAQKKASATLNGENLNDFVKVTVKDSRNHYRDPDVLWYPKDGRGLDLAGYEVEENGDITFAKPGEYQVFAEDRVDHVKSEPITIKAFRITLPDGDSAVNYSLPEDEDGYGVFAAGTGVLIRTDKDKIPYILKGSSGNYTLEINDSDYLFAMPETNLAVSEVETPEDMVILETEDMEAPIYWSLFIPDEDRQDMWINQSRTSLQYDISGWLDQGSYTDSEWAVMKDTAEIAVSNENGSGTGIHLDGTTLTIDKAGTYKISIKMNQDAASMSDTKTASFVVEEIGEETEEDIDAYEKTATLGATEIKDVQLQGDGQIKVTYDPPRDKDGVYIQVATDDLFTENAKYTKVAGDTKKAVVKDLDESKVWKVRVFAYARAEDAMPDDEVLNEEYGIVSQTVTFDFKRVREEKDAQDQADNVRNLINSLPSTSGTENAKDVAKARKAYDRYMAISSDIRKTVKGFDASALEAKLEKAEAQVKKDQKAKSRIRKIKLTGISHKIAAGKKIKLKAVILPKTAKNKKLKWTSSNRKLATVNSKGLVKIKKKTGGKTVRITAMAKDGSKKKAVFKIRIMKGQVKKITVKGAKKTLKAGKTMKLKAKVKATKGSNRKLKWISSNKKAATVTRTGKVKALKAGRGKKVRITVMATDGSGKKAVKTIKIK